MSSDKKVDIFRLNRHDNITEYNLLPPNATDNLSKSPILSSQRVIEGIFHKGVVVCEADADRAVYQSVASVEYMSNQEILLYILIINKLIKMLQDYLLKPKYLLL